jgi:hypothetical protein
VSDVLRDAGDTPDVLDTVRADPRLNGITVYEDVNTCGVPSWSLTPHDVTAYGCPACPHATVQTPLQTVLDRYSPEVQRQVLDSLTQGGPGGAPITAMPQSATSAPLTGLTTRVTGAAAALVLTVGVIAAAVGVGRNDASFVDHLSDPCPPGASRPVADVSGPTVACSGTVTTADGDLLQFLDIVVPTDTALSFSYCDGLRCGDADPECYSNLWIPQFADKVVGSLTLTPPPGATPVEVAAGSGARAGGLSQVSTAPTIGANGSVTIGGLSPVASALSEYVRDGKLCGLTEREYESFRSVHGSNLQNHDSRVVRVVIRWTGGKAPSSVQLNGATQLSL